jgi:hypothetical protein
MKRRAFVKSTLSAAIASQAYTITNGLSSLPAPDFSINKHLVLKGFDDEQEQSPKIVTDGSGTMWMHCVRSLSYPENHEMISSFVFDGKNWNESTPVTKSPAQIEGHTVACAEEGKPVVAWTQIEEGNWIIKVSRMTNDDFDEPHTFSVESGRSINPVLITPGKDKSWIAWENFHKGVLSIYVSKFEDNNWVTPIKINKEKESCFNPGIAEDSKGNLYIIYGTTSGFHQNIEMAVLNGDSMALDKTIAVANGGGHEDRVNINSYPAIAFDGNENLWISYENNRDTSRMEDGDNYTGDRCCSILSYQNGKIVELKDRGKWLFRGENDHKPTFVKDAKGNLYLATYSGGTFKDRSWKYRISWLDPKKGWQDPIELFNTEIKGLMVPPAISFDKKGDFWLSSILEKTFNNHEPVKSEGITRSRLTELNIMQFAGPKPSGKQKPFEFVETKITEFAADEKSIGTYSGHPKVMRRTKVIDGEKYTLIYGNMHEHTNSSNCWPAGTDGTLHDDYRFGMYSEGYDFFGMTDHAGSTSELHWRKNLRIADFYNESEEFIAIPAVEWTLQSDPKLDDIQHGAGHYNIIFASNEDARKYIRNKHEIYCPRTPETNIAPALWKMLDEKGINCVTIPHPYPNQA